MAILLGVSFLLAILGQVLYLYFPHKGSNHVVRRNVLVMIIVMAFLGSFFSEWPALLQVKSTIKLEEFEEAIKNFTHEINIVDVNDKELLRCYKVAVTKADSNSICHCEIKQKANFVAFDRDWRFDWIGTYGGYLMYLFALISVVVAFDFLLKLAALAYVIIGSEKERRHLNGLDVYLLTPKASIPLSSFGFFVNFLFIPPSWQRLTAEEKDAALEHELTHLKNRDSLTILFLELIKIVWWLNPAYYTLRRSIELEQELAADDAVIAKTNNPKSYAQLLLKITELEAAEANGNLKPPVNQLKGSALSWRIQELLNKHQDVKQQPSRLKLLVLLIGSFLYLSLAIIQPSLNKYQKLMLQYELLKTHIQSNNNPYICKACLFEKIQKAMEKQ
jgi:hypothetical protein